MQEFLLTHGEAGLLLCLLHWFIMYNLDYSQTSLIRPLLIQLFPSPAKKQLLEQMFPY